MANTTTSPNMLLPVPVPGTDPGPDWASNIVADMYAIDSHNHSAGQGVQITPSGLNINADLPIGGNNVTAVRSVNFSVQSAPLAAASDLGCVYVSGVDLYYNDENGNQVRITQSGSVTGSTGTITGLPSGTASASYSAGTFTFQGATNTPATMAVGPLVVGSATASPKTVTLAPSASQPANYSLTFPLAAPAVSQGLQSDGSGNLSWIGLVSGTYAPTVTTIVGTSGLASGAFFYSRVGNIVTVSGVLQGTSSAGAELKQVITLPFAPTNNFSAGTDVSGTVSGSLNQTSFGSVTANFPSAKTAVCDMLFTAGGAITRQYAVTFMYSCA